MHTHKKIETLISRPRGLILAASIGLALTTQAQDDWDMGWPFYEPLTQTQKYGISPFYGYRFGGEVQNFETGTTYSFKEGPAYGVFLDYAPMNYYGRYEVLWSHQDSGLDFRGDNGLGDVDVTIDVIQVGGVLEFGQEKLRGYVSGHLGATHFSLAGSGDTRFSWGIGGGGKAFLTKNVYLRADIRGFCTITESEGAFFFHDGVTVASFTGSTFWQGEASAGVGITF